MSEYHAAEPSVRICDRRQGRCLEITVLGRAHDAEDFWDGNWLTCSVQVALPSFTATMSAALRAEEFERFREQLQRIHSGGDGAAVFDPMEPWLELTVTVDADSRVFGRGWVSDVLDGDDRLHFGFDMAPSDLPPVIDSLCAIEARFPVLGLD